MEQLTSFYDNTVTDSFFNLNQGESQLNHAQLYVMSQKLMSSIDISKIVEIYFSQIKKHLNIIGLSLTSHIFSKEIGNCKQSFSSKTIAFDDFHGHPVTIHYFSSEGEHIRSVRTLQELHNCAKGSIKNALQHLELKQSSVRDHLTNLGNRAYFDDNIQRLISLKQRQNRDFGLLVIDMDNFKQINDTLGHLQGDKVLQAFSEVLTNSLRDTDFAFRFGGDEFCCLLQDADSKIGNTIASRIQNGMSQHVLLAKHAISCSIGSAIYESNDSAADIFERADEALYKAKQAGRDCIKTA